MLSCAGKKEFYNAQDVALFVLCKNEIILVVVNMLKYNS